MIQQFRKINLLATAAMLVTFSASVELVSFITPRKTAFVKSDKIETAQQSSLSDPFDVHSDLFRIQTDSPLKLQQLPATLGLGSTDICIINRSDRTISIYVIGYRDKRSKKINQISSFDQKFRHQYEQDMFRGPVSTYGTLHRSALEPFQSEVLSVVVPNVGEFWVDFVEFADGSSSGPYETDAQQTIEGFGAGIKEASSRFIKLFEEGQEPDAVLASIPKEIIDPQLKQHGAKWRGAFAEGFNFVRKDLQLIRKRSQFESQSRELRDLALRGQMKWELVNFEDLKNEGLTTLRFPPLK